MSTEKTPLLQEATKSPTPSHTRDRTSSFYFEQKVSKKKDSSYDAVVTATTNANREEEVDLVPQGISSNAFSSRPVILQDDKQVPKSPQLNVLQKLFKKPSSRTHDDLEAEQRKSDTGSLLKQRKVPIKVEPKVFFANERTFIAWLHVSTILAGGGIAIVAFANANPLSQMYGVVLLPISIAFIGYAMWQCKFYYLLRSVNVNILLDVRRAAMIRRHEPGPYEGEFLCNAYLSRAMYLIYYLIDLIGPTVLGIMLMFSIVLQFTIKMYTLVYH